MAQYRKKPVVVEAIQLTADNVEKVIAFSGDKIKSHPMTGVVIETLEGNTTVNTGAYIVKNKDGNLTPLGAEYFEATYEATDSVKVTRLPSGEKFSYSHEKSCGFVDVISKVVFDPTIMTSSPFNIPELEYKFTIRDKTVSLEVFITTKPNLSMVDKISIDIEDNEDVEDIKLRCIEIIHKRIVLRGVVSFSAPIAKAFMNIRNK